MDSYTETFIRNLELLKSKLANEIVEEKQLLLDLATLEKDINLAHLARFSNNNNINVFRAQELCQSVHMLFMCLRESADLDKISNEQLHSPFFT